MFVTVQFLYVIQDDDFDLCPLEKFISQSFSILSACSSASTVLVKGLFFNVFDSKENIAIIYVI